MASNGRLDGVLAECVGISEVVAVDLPRPLHPAAAEAPPSQWSCRTSEMKDSFAILGK